LGIVVWGIRLSVTAAPLNLYPGRGCGFNGLKSIEPTGVGSNQGQGVRKKED